MDTGAKILIALAIFALLIAVLSAIGIPSFPPEVDAVIETVSDYMSQGRQILNNFCTPVILTSLLTITITLKAIEWAWHLYGFIKRWFE